MKSSSRNWTIFLIITIAAIPIVRWVFLEPLSARFFDLNSSATSLGQIAGLLGMILFSINLILSNRSGFFDHIFGGLQHFYNVHKWLGTLSFSLLLFHPLFLVVKYVSVSVSSAVSFILPGTNFAINMGIVGLLGMIVLLGITFYLKIKYHIWRMSHKFMVAVFIFAIFHTLFIASDVSRDLFLRYYMAFFAILGLLSGFYRAFLRFIFNIDYKFRVSSIRFLNDSVVEIELEPIGKPMEFNFGQFVFIRFKKFDFLSEPHPFSITSASSENNLRFLIKSLGDFTKASNLKKIEKGMIVKAEGPFGSFFDGSGIKKEIWIAGGVGITPFLSKARSLKSNLHNIDLYYCTKDKDEAVLLEELQGISSRESKFKVIPWYSKEKDYINAEAVARLSGELKNTDIYLCGPLGFMRTLKDQFIKKGVDKNNINFEEFNFL